MRHLKRAFLALALIAAASAVRAADFSIDSLTVTYNVATEVYNLTWDGVDPSTDTAQVNYRIYFDYGVVGVTIATATFVEEVSLTNYEFRPVTHSTTPYGTYSFRVFAVDSVTGVGDSAHYVYRFLTNPTRADENGSQVGHGLHWNITSAQQGDANITVGVYPPFTTFTLDSRNFVTATSSPPIRTIMSSVPRSAALNNYALSFAWDSRNSSGSIVANGIYPILMTAVDAAGSVRDTAAIQIPVDILRFTSLGTSGITISQPTASINYTTNGDMLITILICTPGTTFTNASGAGSMTYLGGLFTYTFENHDPLPTDPTSGLVDGSRILRVMRFFRQNGSHTETWPGTDAAGVGQARGIYSMAISGRDDFGNYAVKASGDDGPLGDTIVLDQSAPSSGGGGGGGTPDFFSPSVTSITPANGATVSAVLSAVTAVMTDNTGGSGVNGSNSSVQVRDSSGTLLAGTTSFSGGTYRFTFTNPLTRANNGIYSITATAVDNAGNVSVPSTGTFTVNIEDPNVFATGVPVFAYPNPAKGVSGIDISFNTNRAALMKLQIFNVLGELIYEREFSSAAGAQTVNWDLRNDGGEAISTGFYLYRLSGQDSGATQEIVKKLVVVQ